MLVDASYSKSFKAILGPTIFANIKVKYQCVVGGVSTHTHVVNTTPYQSEPPTHAVTGDSGQCNPITA